VAEQQLEPIVAGVFGRLGAVAAYYLPRKNATATVSTAVCLQLDADGHYAGFAAS
jgi:hypothetical protein